MAYIFSTDANGSNNFQLDSGVLKAELPPSLDYITRNPYDPNCYSPLGTGASPALSTIPRSDPGINLGGVLSGVSATAQSILNLWGEAAAIQDNVANQKLQRAIVEQKTALTSAQTLGALDLAQKQTAASLAIESARLNASVANDMAKVSSGSPGTVSHVASKNMLLIAAVAIGAFFLYKKMGK